MNNILLQHLNRVFRDEAELAVSDDLSESIEKAIRLISEYINVGRYSDSPRILLETAAVRLAGGLSAAPAETAPAAAKPVQAAPLKSVSRTETERKHSEKPQPEQYTEPVTEITPMPREQAGSPDVMWNTVVDTISRSDRSFLSLVGRHSRGTDFDTGELVVTIRPGKMRMAEDKMGDITRAVKSLYGPDVFVTLRAGDPAEARAAVKTDTAAEEETSRIIDNDVNVSEVADDIETLFGIRPEITG